MSSYECKCGEILTDISYHWLGKRVNRHLIEDHEGKALEKIGKGQITLEGKTAMFIKKQPYSTVTTIQRGETAMPEKWKKRESGGTWPPKDVKAGASMEGKVVRFEENANSTADKPLRDIILETPKGEVRVWGSAILQRKVTEADSGKEIRITYKGLVKVKRGKAKDFEVEVKE